MTGEVNAGSNPVMGKDLYFRERLSLTRLHTVTFARDQLSSHQYGVDVLTTGQRESGSVFDVFTLSVPKAV